MAHRTVNWKLLVLFTMLLAGCWALLPGMSEPLVHDYRDDLDRDLPDHARAHFEYIKGHLDEPFDGYTRADVFDPSFAVIALSHMASGMMNIARAEPARRKELTRYTRELIERALSPKVSPYGQSPEKVGQLGEHGLYLSHLNLILGVHRYVSGSPRYDELHSRISRHLRRRSMAGDDWHVQSYPGSWRYQWPADQSVTLASLYLYDQVHGTQLSQAPIRGWLQYVSAHSDVKTELPFSALRGAFDYAEWPRGCALSWTALYMVQFSPEEATKLYEDYRHAFSTETWGWGGFREWPYGHDRGMDVDSGPIIFGMGMAATGLGLGPARIFGDERSYTRIMRAAANVGLPNPSVLDGERSYAMAPLLGEAILFNGTTARVWFEPPPPDAYHDAPEFPLGSVVFVLVFLLWAGLCVYAIWRERRAKRRLARFKNTVSDTHETLQI